ncbi:MAG TPA: amino acid adenylation domain-containing protein [Pyrinomonadaceae bacterium]|nr:amino acid adenylation domain-containing protein [Pyrinomonadaceae bacterium]
MKNVEDIYPLTPMQQGLLFYHLYAPHSGLYIEHLNATLSGNLDLAAFEQAWLKLIERHAVLRTAFLWEGLDEPLQVVRRNVSLPLVQHDWSGVSADAQRQQLAELLQADRSRGFNLSESPLIRLHLIRLTEAEHRLVWSFHHLLLDGWSTFIVLGEFLSIYDALCHDRQPQLEPRRPFRDYILWLQQQDYQKAAAFWQQTLQGFTAPTQLSLLSPSLNGDRYAHEYATEELILPAELATALTELARKQWLTLNTLVQGAWALLLSRYSGEDEVTFGVTVAGRPASLAGFDRMVGLFINTLPLRVRVAEETALLHWLRQLQEQQIKLREFEYSSLPEVQKQSGAGRQLLFESLLVFENYPIDAVLQKNGSSLRIGDVEILEKTNYPLNLLVRPGPSALSLQMVYDPGRCDGVVIKRMMGHLRNVLESFVASPDRSLASISLLTAVEEQQVLRDWNNTGIARSETSLQQLFEEQVEQTPGAAALTFADQQLNYRDLNRRANQLAHYLRRLGVDLDQPVGIMMERSIELVVGLLGILKAGGAYVPFDPSYPEKRLDFMMQDAQVRVLLTQSHLAAKTGTQAAKVICLDAILDQLEREDETNPAVRIAPENLAYVIYTSGSTGQPKGAMNTHSAICNRLLWAQSVYELTERDCVLQKTPFSFDVSVWEFFLPLITGARLVLAKPGGHRDSEYLVELIRKENVTILHFVPSMLQVFLETSAIESCTSLRRVVCSGEALPFELQQRFFERLGADLQNLYGPTEAAVDVTFWECRRDGDQKVVPIGKPIANTQMYVLDRQQRVVPVGVNGELYIGGDGLARGYLNRPELTAEKFVPHPFSEREGARLYRTGDVGRWLSDGSIEFLGRVDEQVKLRGFRIELGEIEVALQQHPALREAVVVVREPAPQQKQLVAYVVAHDESVTTAELRTYLKGLLPEYMIPQVFVNLNEIPLTPNGKVDRRALPVPENVERAAMEAARTPVEEVLLGIWSEVLGVAVGVADDFFELGGHSLLATQVVSRARAAFGIELTLPELFESPTVQDLAAVVERALVRGEEVPAPPLRRVERSGELPLSFAQQRLWFIDQLEPDGVLYNSPFAATLTGHLNIDAFAQTLNEIVRRHEVLRTTFKFVNGQPVQVIHPPAKVELPVIDLGYVNAGQREEEALRLAREEAVQPFVLSEGPLLRVKLLRLDENKHIVLLTIHHIVTDEWSMGVFVNEVATLYTAFAKGETSPLPELPIQYADFAVWQREWLRGEVLNEKLAYWRKELSGVPPLLKLPTDHPRPAVQTFRGSIFTFALPDSLKDGLKKLSRQESCTLFMTLLAAFKVLLYRYTQQSDIVIGTAIANRTRSETEALIGFFVNTLVLRTNLSGNPRFREFLHHVREATLRAYSHQDVPFEKIVEEVAPERQTNYTPVIQAYFGMRNAPMPQLELPALTLQTIDLDDHGGRFDLTLWMFERDGTLKGKWYYNSDLFELTTIQRIQSHFQTLLQSIVDYPEERLRALEIYTEEEKEQQLNQRRTRDQSDIQRLRAAKRKSQEKIFSA